MTVPSSAAPRPTTRLLATATRGAARNPILDFSGTIYHGFITVKSAKQTKELRGPPGVAQGTLNTRQYLYDKEL